MAGSEHAPVRVVVADDHVLFCQTLRPVLEREGFEIVGEAFNGRDAVEVIKQTRPDVALLDVSMPLLNGLEVADAIRSDCPQTRVILLTVNADPEFISEAFKRGIAGYVLKTMAADVLAQVVREVSEGATYISGGLTRSEPEPLSPRERQVLQLIAEGKSRKQIASALGLSAKTVESHRSAILAKLRMGNTAELVRYAIRRGLVRP